MAPPPELYDQDTAEPENVRRGRRRTSDGAPQLRSPSAPRQARTRPPRTERARSIWGGRIGWVLPLVVLVGSLLGLYLVASDRFDVTGGDDASDAEPDGLARTATAGPSALLVQTDGGGRALSFTLIALDGDSGGTAVLLPPSTMVEIPGFGLDQLSKAVDLGGVPLAELSLRNLLSIDFAHTVTLGPDDLGALSRTLGDVVVENPARLDRVDEAGRIEVLWPEGRVAVASADVADFLATRALGETELERLVRHQRFWIAYLDARQSIVGVVDDPTLDLDAFLDEASVRASELDYRILPVETIGGPEELYRLDVAGLADLLAVIAPAPDDVDVSRVRVQVLNGVGTPGLAEPVTSLLLPTGAVVQLTGNALEFDHEITQIVYYRDEHVASALLIRDELGLGEVVKQRDPIDVVDITVVIGRDLADRITE